MIFEHTPNFNAFNLLTYFFNFRFLLNMLCKQQPIYLKKCCKLKQRFLHVWHGIDHADRVIDKWHGRLRACVRAKGRLRSTIFSHMTRDVSVFVKCVTIFRLFFFKLPQFHTSNFRKVVRQHTVTTLSGRAWFGEISSKVDDACVVKHDTDVVV